MTDSTPELTPTLPMDLPPPEAAPPAAWTGGKPSGERLTVMERMIIRQLFADGCNYSEIEQRTTHGRKTIAAVIAADPAIVKSLQETRAARMLVEEDMLMEERSEAIEKKRKTGKLSVGDLTSALMVNGILVKEAGGSAPQRVRLEADPSLVLAAQLFAGLGQVPGAGLIIEVPATPAAAPAADAPGLPALPEQAAELIPAPILHPEARETV